MTSIRPHSVLRQHHSFFLGCPVPFCRITGRESQVPQLPGRRRRDPFTPLPPHSSGTGTAPKSPLDGADRIRASSGSAYTSAVWRHVSIVRAGGAGLSIDEPARSDAISSSTKSATSSPDK